MTGVEHPLLDFGGEGFAATETRTPVVFLSAGRVSLLAAAQAAGKRAVLVTDELSVLTPAMGAVWREGGGGWVVRSAGQVGGAPATGTSSGGVGGRPPTWPGQVGGAPATGTSSGGVGGRPPTWTGLREGFTGRKLASVADLLTVARAREVDDIDLGYLRPSPADAVQAGVIVSLRHPARAETLLGGPAEELATLLTGRPPRLWGPLEPVGQVWDRSALTAFARQQMPGPILTVASGGGFAATVQVQRTSSGLEEITEAQLSLGVPSTTGFEDQRRRLLGWLADLAARAMPLAALVLARPGRADLLVPPLLTHPRNPLALLIGAPGVRAMKIDVDAMVERFGALRVGRPRIPGVLFGLGTLGEPGWQRLDAVLAAVGREEIAAATGLSMRHLTPPEPEGAADGEQP